MAGTFVFSMDHGDIAEEAHDRAGLELRTGKDIRRARQSLNLLTTEWSNRGVNLWQVQNVTWDVNGDGTGSEFLSEGQATYSLAPNTISLFEVLLRTDDADPQKQNDSTVVRINMRDYAAFPNKLIKGTPSQYYHNRIGKQDLTRDTITVYPTPDSSTKYKLNYWRMGPTADAGSDTGKGFEVPTRFLPAAVAGLAYHVAMNSKDPVAVQRIPMLKAEYQEQFSLAAGEDREKAPTRWVPFVGSR